MLELQQAEATWMGGESAARYHDAQYAMAVLADETLSTIDWKGKSAWMQFSLEQKLFKSSAADLEFFKRVDRLFKDGVPTEASRDLARVYLLTIAAGFRGKYGQFGLTRALHEYRQRLYEYIHGGDALLLYAEDRAIFPDAASHTIAGRATARVSGAQRWIAVLLVVLLGYTILAHFAWNRASSELRDVTARVEATNSPGAR
jgi:type VI secretion system protein ImpK